MSALSDQELMLLENLTYLNGNVFEAAGIQKSADPESVRELLNMFDEDALNKLENYSGQKNGITENDVSAFMTGKEWAATIRAIKANRDLMDLKIINSDSKVYASCYEDPSGRAYVTFKGTTGGDEWYDDVAGLNEADTLSQKEALDYIEGLPYDDITVVGHSKGGNKAQYVSITSDKVNRCISMDGQGFSQEFLDKYEAEIERNGSKIKNYSLSTDYVHILLFYMPGAEQIYCQGDPSKAGARNHSPGAYYEYCEKDGKWYIRMNGSNTKITRVPENEGMTYLHEFTCFVLNTASDADKKKIVEYIGIALALAMGEESFTVTVEGVTYGKKDLTKFLLSDQETMAMIFAYVMKYGETYGLSEEQLRSLLEAFGFGELLDEIEQAFRALLITNPALAGALTAIGASVGAFLHFLYKQITDGKDDKIIQQILGWLGDWLSDELGVKINAEEIWKKVEETYNSIGDVDKSTATKDRSYKATRFFDYSNRVYEQLMSAINSINSLTCRSVGGWNSYAGEEWFDDLGVRVMMNGVNGYFERLSEINANCRGQIERIFADVRSIDQAKSRQITEITESIRAYSVTAQEIAGGLG